MFEKKKKDKSEGLRYVCVSLSAVFDFFLRVFFFPSTLCFFFFYPSLFISSTINGLSLLFSFYMLLLRTHTHTCQRTCTGSKSWDCLFACFFFFLTILWRTHTYLLHIFIFYWFSVCSVIGHKAPAFFVVVVVRSVVLSLLSLTSVLHFLASEVFLFFFFFC